jgi:hypothetical protein
VCGDLLVRGWGGGGHEISFLKVKGTYMRESYCRYVDDILIIFDANHSNILDITKDFNSLHPKLQFTAETEIDHNLNYLHISINRTPTHLTTAIFRKPTFTDTIIPFTSNHSRQHKYAAIRYLYDRLNSYDLEQQEYQQELNIIHNILHNNSFPIIPHRARAPNRDKQSLNHTTRKWACFTYVGKETSYVTNIFKRTDLKSTFRTTNTLANLLTQKKLYPRQILALRSIQTHLP